MLPTCRQCKQTTCAIDLEAPVLMVHVRGTSVIGFRCPLFPFASTFQCSADPRQSDGQLVIYDFKLRPGQLRSSAPDGYIIGMRPATLNYRALVQTQETADAKGWNWDRHIELKRKASKN